MLRAAQGNEIIVEAERELYTARLERLLRKALARADDPKLSPMIQYLNLQLAATLAEKIAAANGVATRPKVEADLNLREKFDPARGTRPRSRGAAEAPCSREAHRHQTLNAG
jgi:hypothetical protein